jgi:acyl-CoA reductase-like NAD-dependent aldehyde dehydrogenase
MQVHESVIDQFLEQFIPAIDGLKWGLPWEAGVAITPLPEPKKPQYLRDLIVDAKAHGAKVVNEHLGGSKMHGNYCCSAMLSLL